MNVIPFHRLADQPDAAHVLRMGERTFYRYALSYTHQDGKRFAIDIWAESWEDAEARVSAMQQGLKLDGQIYAEVPS